MKTKILVASHKLYKTPKDALYLPIYVGADLSDSQIEGFIADNTGDNISYKNKTFCELTALYWAWKNLKDIDAIGLCHYRRYFCESKQAYCHQIMLDDKIVGYYLLYFKRIELEKVNNLMGDDYGNEVVNHYTSVHIHYIAIDEAIQNSKIGTFVLKGIISEIMDLSKYYPIRMITLDSLNKYHDWYYKIGFRDIPGIVNNSGVIPMYLDCMSEDNIRKLENYCEK